MDDKLAFRIIITFLCPFLPQFVCGSDIQPAKSRKENKRKSLYHFLIIIVTVTVMMNISSYFPTTSYHEIEVDSVRMGSVSCFKLNVFKNTTDTNISAFPYNK